MQREPNSRTHCMENEGIWTTDHPNLPCNSNRLKRTCIAICAFPIIYLFMGHGCFHLEDSFVLVHHRQKLLPWWCQRTLLTLTKCPLQNGANIHKGPWALPLGKHLFPLVDLTFLGVICETIYPSCCVVQKLSLL